MDTNEINLDEFDKSDISSDWNSSEDEAPTMEVEEEKASLPAQQTQQPMDYAQEIEELEQMELQRRNRIDLMRQGGGEGGA